MQRSTDKDFGNVGVPFHSDIKIKLRNWEEGGYKVTHSEGPQGEILVSGAVVAEGYWNQPGLTAESFITDKDGSKWFCSGDIGFFDVQEGVFKIIDRKKDLIKLQMGQFVSLGKVEACLRMHGIVENVCVIADPLKDHCVALIVPDIDLLQAMAQNLGLKFDNLEDLCQNPVLIEHVLTQLLDLSQKHLKSFETPKRIGLIPQIWTPEAGLVTATLKPKRKAIMEEYQDVIQQLYSS